MKKHEATLYGIARSNRSAKDLWGKNQFNSSFPVALACYMRDNDIPAQYVYVDEDLNVSIRDISFNDVFNSRKDNVELNFDFESKYDPYQAYATDDIKNIDLVIRDSGIPIRPLEIKLTAVPDEATHLMPPENWGCELVVRPASTSYAALGMFDSVRDNVELAQKILSTPSREIRAWDNLYEIKAHLPRILSSLDEFQLNFLQKQKPFLLQTIWKTKGKAPYFDNNAFDIFVWSDFSLCRLFINNSRRDAFKGKINRFERSSARLLRTLFDATTRGFVHIKSIYTEMAFDLQTDKEFAANGRITSKYLKSGRLVNPIVKKDELFDIILNGGELLLSPERRLDQSVYLQALLDGKIVP